MHRPDSPRPAPARLAALGLLIPLAVIAAPAAPALPTAVTPALAAATVAKNVTANLFEYNWPSVAADCTDVLGPDGFAAVQVAPPEDSYDNAAHAWWDVYQPVDYTLNSRMGTAAQFTSMVQACHAAGVKVYADAVLNHMAAGDGGQDVSYAGQPFDSATPTYPAYGAADFHTYPANCPESNDSIDNWLSYTDVTRCRLDGLPDLATETSYVRTAEAGYLNSLIADGVDGFRLDSAAELGETDIAAIEALLSPDTTTGQPVAITQEVYPGSTGQDARLNPTSFEPEGAVTSFDYSYAVTDDFENGDLAALNSVSPQLPSADASSFVTNQDTERASTPTLHYTNGAAYVLADEFLLAYGYGAPQIYSSFEYAASDQAPPDDANGFVTGTVCGTGAWECTEQNPAIDALVGWHNLAYTDADPVAHWSTDGNNLVAFSRGTDAWIALNNGASALTSTFTTGLANGTYCDLVNDGYSGGTCSGTGIKVSGGQATVTVPAYGSVALDVDSRISAPAITETFDVTVPASTPASAQVYLAGNLSVLGEGQSDWAPNGVPMTKVSATEWTVTLTAAATATLQYKYTLNGSWSTNEETAGCGYVANRSVSVDGGTRTDTVADWEGYGGC